MEFTRSFVRRDDKFLYQLIVTFWQDGDTGWGLVEAVRIPIKADILLDTQRAFVGPAADIGPMEVLKVQYLLAEVETPAVLNTALLEEFERARTTYLHQASLEKSYVGTPE